MLNIEKQEDFTLTEYQCDMCGRWFLTKGEWKETLVCPFCGGDAWVNGSFEIEEIKIKKNKDDE